MSQVLLDDMLHKKMIAIVRGVDPDDILATARALLDGGISMMEITFDHSNKEGIENTLKSLTVLNEKMGDHIALGAGTVLTEEQVSDAFKCGAKYIISPDTNKKVINKTKDLGMISIPGALTPTEIVTAHSAGCDIVKLFPAGMWGPDYIKAVRSPLSHIPLAAVGGVVPENIASFFKAGAACVGIGSNLVNVAAVKNRRFIEITNMAKRFVEALN